MSNPPIAGGGATHFPKSALILLGLIAVFWGLNWPIMKIGLSEVPPFVFRTVSSLAGAAGLFLIARASGAPLAVPQRDRRGLILSSFFNVTLWNVLVLYGIALMASGRAAILAYTMPLWATLVGFFWLGERPNRRTLGALALGLIGTVLLFFAGGTAPGSLWGPLFVVLAAFSWGVGTVAVKVYRFSMPVTVFSAWQHLIGTLPIAIIALVWDIDHLHSLSLWPTLCVVYNMTVAAIFCHWAYFKVVGMLPIAASTLGTLLVPVIGLLSSALIFRQAPAWIDYLALALICIAVFLALRRR